MKRKSILVMLAGLMILVGCKKESEPTSVPTGNAFSIASGKRVCIAEGNLQYQPSTATWRIAPTPWTASKEDNIQASPTFEGWVDYFGWGFSGEGSHQPYDLVYDPELCYHAGDLTGTPYDWGVRNAIDNNGTIDPAGTWRTLSSDEWEYIINQRSASTINGVANARYANATVAVQPGIILFPDNPQFAEGVVLPADFSINVPYAYETNVYSAQDWEKFQEAGCVFLPALGCRSTSIDNLIACNFLGCYWTSSQLGDDDGLYLGGQLNFNPNLVKLGTAGVIYPRNVRLAKDIK